MFCSAIFLNNKQTTSFMTEENPISIIDLVSDATIEKNQKLIDIHEFFGLHFLIRAEKIKPINREKAAEYAMHAWAHMRFADNGHYLQLIKQDYIDNCIFDTDMPYNVLRIASSLGDYVHELHQKGEKLLMLSGIEV